MKYKLTGLILILLIATPLHGQKLKPIGVELIPAVPTTAKTAEPFTIGYRIRYLDLARWNKKIVLFSKDLADEEVQREFQRQIGSFKVSAVYRSGLIYKDGEFLQDFYITLVIIDKKKGAKKIPKLQFAWALKEAGQEEGKLKSETPIESPEVHINYVTTIPANDPYLDIRDGLKLGDFSSQARRYLFYVPAVLSLFFFVWLFSLVRWLKMPKQAKPVMSDEGALVAKEAKDYVLAEETLSFSQARRALTRAVKRLFSDPLGRDSLSLSVEREFYTSLRTFFMAAMPGLNPGDTPRQILRHIESIKDQPLKDVYLELAWVMVGYWNDLQRNNGSIYGIKKMTDIYRLVKRLRWHNRFFAGVVWRIRNLAYKVKKRKIND